MANGVLGLGMGAASLNSELIEKLKTAEKRSVVEPLEKKLEKFAPERESINNIGTKVDDLLAAVKVFSLNQSSGVTAFNQKSASASGDSVIFDAADLSTLKKGFTQVNVIQLAQKDVWQTSGANIDNAQKDQKVDKGILTVNGKEFDTAKFTYNELVKEINKELPGVSASLADVGSTGFRLSIKSNETGLDNKISISGGTLGFENVLEAKDMIMKVDGVEYKKSSNTITVDGLKISATKTGESTINIEDDDSQLTKQMANFAKAYNELNALIDSEVYSADSKISEKNVLRDIMAKIKGHLFETGNSDKSIFSYGFSLNEKNGDLIFNESEFKEATKDGKKGLENLFTGVSEKQGIATLLDETISVMGVKKTLLDYDLNMISKEEKMKKDKTIAEESLNKKYEQLSLQFASYNSLINQMESSFAGLKMMIQQSVASN